MWMHAYVMVPELSTDVIHCIYATVNLFEAFTYVSRVLQTKVELLFLYLEHH